MWAVCPFTVTVIFPLYALTGTMMVNCVAVAETTSANSSFNFTILLTGSALKFDPVITIFAPIVSVFGEIPVMDRDGEGGALSFFLQLCISKQMETRHESARENKDLDFSHGGKFSRLRSAICKRRNMQICISIPVS